MTLLKSLVLLEFYIHPELLARLRTRLLYNLDKNSLLDPEVIDKLRICAFFSNPLLKDVSKDGDLEKFKMAFFFYSYDSRFMTTFQKQERKEAVQLMLEAKIATLDRLETSASLYYQASKTFL